MEPAHQEVGHDHPAELLTGITAIRAWSPVRAMIRRHARSDRPSGMLQLGDVSVDMTRRIARKGDGREVRFTPLEHRILESLLRHGDRIMTHAALINEVWGPNRDDARALRVYIGSLRRKLEADPSRPRHILTELGIGYRLVMDS